MTPARKLAATTVLSSLILASIVLLAGPRPFSPTLPVPELDSSWIVVTGEEAGKGTRWGVDLMFTFGPAATLSTGYMAGNYYPVIMPILLLVALVFGVSVTVLLSTARSWTRLVLAGVTVAFVSLDFHDSFFLSFSFVVFLLALRSADADRLVRIVTVLGVVALGMCGLSKFSFFMLSLALLVVADGHRVVNRKPPILVGSFVLSTALWFIVIGQRLVDLPQYVLMGIDIAGWYSEAMGVLGNPLEIIVFLFLCVAFVAGVVFVERQTTSGQRSVARLTFLCIGIGVFCWLLFKAGFVRHDDHAMTAWLALPGGVALYFLSVMPSYKGRTPGSFVAVFLVVLVICPPLRHVLSEGTASPVIDLGRFYRYYLLSRPLAEVGRVVEFIAGPDAFMAARRADMDEAWGKVRAGSPLPDLEGAVDAIPSVQNAVIANGLDYHPRPSFHEYGTYSPRLIEANRRHYSSGDAPTWVVFEPTTLDNRYPAFTEGALWPRLLSSYVPVEFAGQASILRRRDHPVDGMLGKPVVADAALGRRFAVEGGGPVFAKVRVRRSWFGSLSNVLFRPPMLGMTVHLSDGRAGTFRFIPEVAAAGFVLSPFVASSADYASLALARPDLPQPPEVVAFVIDGGALSHLAYDSRIEVTTRAIDTSRLK